MIYVNATRNTSRLTQLDVVGNVLEGDTVGGLPNVVGVGGGLELRNSSFVDNTLTSGNLTAVVLNNGLQDQGTVESRYANAYDNSAGDAYSGQIDSLVGELSVDPGYVSRAGANPLGWNLKLSGTGSAVDAGDPEDEDADGSDCDLGAYGGPDGDGWPR